VICKKLCVINVRLNNVKAALPKSVYFPLCLILHQYDTVCDFRLNQKAEFGVLFAKHGVCQLTVMLL